MAGSVPLSRSTSRFGGGSAFYVRTREPALLMPSKAEKQKRRQTVRAVLKSQQLEERRVERARRLEQAILSIPEKLDRISSQLEDSNCNGDVVHSMIQEIRDRLCNDQ